MGKLLSKLPTDVHLGKFLLISTLFRCLDPALTIAATLNSKSPFVAPFGFEQDAARARNSFRIGKLACHQRSDNTILNVIIKKTLISLPFTMPFRAGARLALSLVLLPSSVERTF